MPSSPTDTPLPIPAAVPPGASRKAILQAIFEATIDGRIGTPQERLAALQAKVKRDRFLERMKRLSLREQGQIYLRLIVGDDPEELLPE